MRGAAAAISASCKFAHPLKMRVAGAEMRLLSRRGENGRRSAAASSGPNRAVSYCPSFLCHLRFAKDDLVTWVKNVCRSVRYFHLLFLLPSLVFVMSHFRNRALSFVVYVTHQKVASVLVAVNDCDVLVHNKRLFGVTLMNWPPQERILSIIGIRKLLIQLLAFLAFAKVTGKRPTDFRILAVSWHCFANE